MPGSQTSAGFVLPALVGPSRLELGVHWPTDVVAGLALGTCSALTVSAIAAWFANTARPWPGAGTRLDHVVRFLTWRRARPTMRIAAEVGPRPGPPIGQLAVVNLLPMSTDPLPAPSDRDMLPSERREFVRTHRTCIFGYGRSSDGPTMSVVYYVPTDDDELLIATMAERAKARAVARSSKVSLCILDETWPFSYLQVCCDAVVDTDRESVVDVMTAVAERMSGEPLDKELRPAVESMAEEEQRVLLRCRPYATFATPPRHLHRNDQDERLTHWVAASMPWDASDTPDEAAQHP